MLIRTVDFEVDAVLDGVRADGVVVCEGVLDADRVAAIRGDLDRGTVEEAGFEHAPRSRSAHRRVR